MKEIESGAPVQQQAKPSAEDNLLYVAIKYKAVIIAAIETKKMVGGLTSLDTASLGFADIGPVLYLINHVPPVVSNAVSTTGKLLKYLSANKVDVTEANKAASDLGV